MNLNKIFAKAPSIEIKGLAIDSRLDNPDGIFFCIRGLKYDGHDFVKEAINHGAKVIVYSADIDKSLKAVYIKVDDVVKVLNQTLRIFYCDPSKQLDLIGVTGTYGKTTTCSIVRQLFESKGSYGYIGTLGTFFGDKYYSNTLTTPSYIELNAYLKQMVDAQIKGAIIETTSVALEQKRTDSLEFKVAVFTNIYGENVESHGTMRDYFAAKKRLFDSLSSSSYAITNADNEYGRQIVADTVATIITYGIENEADIMAFDLKFSHNATAFVLKCFNHNYLIKTNLIGRFNVYNLLAAIAVYYAYGFDIAEVIPKLNNILPINGRMYRIDVGQNYNVIVDYARTAVCLKSVYEYATAITPIKNKIISVFGSEGGRDDHKRKILGEMADQSSDLIILTEDDYGSEEPNRINETIAKYIQRKTFINILDRETAIMTAVDLMNSGDTLLILGKGDENYMIRSFGKESYSGDANLARNRIKERLKEENDEIS